MRLLLDTHAFLWWVSDDARLSRRARPAMASSPCLLSLASCWELTIKVSLRKLTLSKPVGRFVQEQIEINRFTLLGLTLEHVAKLDALPFHHRDPFDRLLAAQAAVEDLAVVSADPIFRRYGVTRVW